MTPSFSNLAISRIIIQEAPNLHRINPESPVQRSTSLTILDSKGLDVLTCRLVDALGGHSHSVEVDVVEFGPLSTFRAMVEALDADATEFVETSSELASRLIGVQGSPSVKDGIMVLIQGTLDEDSLRFIIVMKAESDAGFSRQQSPEGIVLRFIEQLVLTAKQRLYKVGCFIESKTRNTTGDPAPPDFQAVVFDHLIRKDGEGKPAGYFYHGFLGCDLKKTAKQETTTYFDSACKSIDSLPATAEKKFEYRSALNAYMSSPQPVVSVKKFMDDYIDPDHQDAFSKSMKDAGVPSTNIAKDISGIKSRLVKRRLRFDTGVTVSGTDDAMRKNVHILPSADKRSVTLTIEGSIKDQS